VRERGERQLGERGVGGGRIGLGGGQGAEGEDDGCDDKSTLKRV
jgi:hypothetical protein